MNWQAVLIDVIIIAVIGVFVYVSARRGFVRVLIETVGFVAAVIISFTICTPLSNLTYDKIIEPPIITTASNEVHNSINEATDSIIDKLPDYLKDYLIKSGIKENLISQNEDKIESGTYDFLADISQNKIKPVVTKIMATVYCAIILTVLLIAVKILARIFNKCFSIKQIAKLNTALGGLCGLIKGTAFVLIICFIIWLLIPITDNGIWIFSAQNIDKTYIFRFLISLGEF